jgi:hypothetical protein
MSWLLRRVLIVWSILLVISITAILLARQIRVPGALQAFGFEVCDGEPCFRGIMPGMNWETAQGRFADGTIFNPSLTEFKVGSNLIAVRHEDDVVSQIKLSTRNSGKTEERMTIGAVIAHYGPPCAVRIKEKEQRMWELRYPNSLVEVVLIPAPEELGPALRKFGVSNAVVKGALTEPKLRLHMDLPIYTFTIHAPTPCKLVRDDLNGVWHGLTTSDVYQVLFHRSAPAEQKATVKQ